MTQTNLLSPLLQQSHSSSCIKSCLCLLFCCFKVNKISKNNIR